MTDLVWERHGDGPPVVLVPAAIGSRRQWDAVVDDLAEDFTVVTFDPRAQGESPNPTADYDDVADLATVMDAADVGRAVVVGCSNGGRVAASLAVTAPDRVAGLVLFGPALPGVTWRDHPDDRHRLNAADEAIAAGDFDVAVEVYADYFFVGQDRTPDDLPHNLASRMRSLLMAAVAREQGAWDLGEPTGIDPPLRDRLEDVAVPTLVAVGVHDHPSLQATAREYAARVPDATMQMLSGVAHFPALEAPAVTAELVRDHASLVIDMERHAG